MVSSRSCRLGTYALILLAGCGARTPLAEEQASPADAASEWTPILNLPLHIALGSYHTCTTRIDNALYCWGSNSVGQLGDGTTTRRSLPKQVVLPSAAITDLVAGYRHTCAALVSSEVYCWGENTQGQVGVVDAGASVLQPTLVPLPKGGIGDVIGLAAGEYHTCAAYSDGRLFCWGSNSQGQLGLGSNSFQSAPTQVPLPGGVDHVVAGDFHTCASLHVNQQDEIYCWGQNFSGQIGDGTLQDSPQPVRAKIPQPVRALRSKGFVNLAISKSGDAEGNVRLIGWGDNTSFVLGGKLGKIVSTPTEVGPLWNLSTLSVGLVHACAVRWTPDAPTETYCWGGNGQGQLGDGTTTSRPGPENAALTIDAIRVEAGPLHTCAIDPNALVWCWGDNEFGQLGEGTQQQRLSPTQVKGF